MTMEEAIQALKDLRDIRLQGVEWKKSLDMAIEALSAEAVQGWIPCDTSSMPPEGEAVLMSDGKHIWIDCTVASWGDRSEWIGTAWMPMPKPSVDIPSVEWKLASEELPQSVGSYIVTCEDKYGSVYVDYDFWTVADEFKYNGSKVTAWIPFPKPYCPNCGVKMKGENK